MFIKSVRLENFVTFKEALVDFDSKLNIFFGESGAGKSLFLEAILGAFTKLKKDFVGIYGDCARVCVEVELDGCQYKIVHAVNRKGKTEVFSDLHEPHIFAKQIIYSGQGAYAELLDPKEQLECLDSFIQKFEPLELPRLRELLNKKNAVSEELDQVKKKLDQLSHMRDFFKSKRRLIDIMTEYELISEVNIEQQLKFRKVASYIEALDEIRNDFSRLKVALTSFLKRTALEDQEGLRNLVALENWLNDVSKSLQANVCPLSEEVLWEIKFFFDDLKKICPNFDFSRLSSFEKNLSSEISELEKVIFQLEKDLQALEEQSILLAGEISAKRKLYFSKFVKDLANALSELNFSHVQFEAKFSQVKLTDKGMDSFELLSSFNRGFQCRPLRKIASGGEFARFLVALLITSRLRKPNQILLLDEPDTGLSGESFQKLVRLIESLSESSQVLMVSHQYQEYRGRKFFVEKKEVAGKSVSVVTVVDKKGG